MAAGCVANTASVATSIDGAGTLRSGVIVSPNTNNTLVQEANGLAVRNGSVLVGWPFTGNDTYATPAGVAPQFGPLVYGPEIFAQVQAPTSECVMAHVEWETQVGYSGSNTFSGITFSLEISFDHTNWTEFATQANYAPISQTVLWHASAHYPLCFADTAAHNVWVRLVLSAGAFGTGDVATAQFSRRRSIMFQY